MLVPANNVMQGTAFPLIGADLGPHATVRLELHARGRVLSLGTVPAAGDGHFEVSLVMPQDAPDGYAELRAETDDGVRARVWVLIGERPDVDVGPPVGEPWLVDPSLLGLLGLAGAGAGARVLLGRNRLRARR